MSGHHEANFLKRLEKNLELKEKNSLAAIIAEHLVEPGERVFLAVGTTVFVIAKKLMSSVKNLGLTTNCIPIAQLHLELERDEKLAQSVSMEVLPGKVNHETSVIDHLRHKTNLTSTTMIWAPHGITKRGLTSEHHAAVTENLYDRHDRVIIPTTFSKFGRQASDVMKKMGFISKPRKRKGGESQVIVVLPAVDPPDTSKHKIEDILEIIELLQKSNVAIFPKTRPKELEKLLKA